MYVPLLHVNAVIDSFWVLALRKSDWRNCGLCIGLYAENGATLLVGIWWQKKIKLVKWKVLIDTMGIKSANMKDKF